VAGRLAADQIDVIVSPGESAFRSTRSSSYADAAVLAQLLPSDMRLPINSLCFITERVTGGESARLSKLSARTSSRADRERFAILLELASRCPQGAAPAGRAPRATRPTGVGHSSPMILLSPRHRPALSGGARRHRLLTPAPRRTAHALDSWCAAEGWRLTPTCTTGPVTRSRPDPHRIRRRSRNDIAEAGRSTFHRQPDHGRRGVVELKSRVPQNALSLVFTSAVVAAVCIWLDSIDS